MNDRGGFSKFNIVIKDNANAKVQINEGDGTQINYNNSPSEGKERHEQPFDEAEEVVDIVEDNIEVESGKLKVESEELEIDSTHSVGAGRVPARDVDSDEVAGQDGSVLDSRFEEAKVKAALRKVYMDKNPQYASIRGLKRYAVMYRVLREENIVTLRSAKAFTLWMNKVTGEKFKESPLSRLAVDSDLSSQLRTYDISDWGKVSEVHSAFAKAIKGALGEYRYIKGSRTYVVDREFLRK